MQKLWAHSLFAGVAIDAHAAAYQHDLAYIHDVGFGEFARRSAPNLLSLFRRHGIKEGSVVDLGCGSGIWSRALADAGFQAIGVDLSPAMIEIARQRVPEGAFHVASFLDFPIPPCRAVTALSEVCNYLFDRRNSLRSLRRLSRNVYGALAPNGLFVFDVVEPDGRQGMRKSFAEGPDWTCLVEYRHDAVRKRLTRRIISFRKVDGNYRRQEETHTQKLFHGSDLAEMLRGIGFEVRLVRRYGKHRLPKGTVGIVARKP